VAPANSSNGGESDKKDEKDLRIEQLEKELLQSREDMRAITEDQEAANEELQSANEELLSGGEELQSLNEELETSKEELQSTNEEIIAVNQELIGLNEQVTQERNFSEEIIKTMRESLVVLDKDLKIISANSAFYETFQVNEPETVGKLIYDLGNKQWDNPELRSLLESILPEKESFVDFEMTYTFESIGKRTMLLNAREIKREGKSKKMTLLAIEDITDRKQALESIAEARDRLYFAIEAAHLGTFDHNPVTNKFTANDRLKKWFGLQPGDEIELGDAIVERDRKRVGEAIKETLEFSSGGYYDIIYNLAGRDDLEERVVRAQARAYFDENKTAYRLIGIVEDITERSQAEEKIAESVHRYHEMIHSSPSLIAILEGKDLVVTVANNAFLEKLGKGPGIIGKPYLDSVPELEEQGLGDYLREVYKTGKPYKAHEMPLYILREGEKELNYYNFVYQPQRDDKGNVIGVAIIANEVTAQAELNKEIKESEARYHQMTDLMPDMITNANVDGEVFYYNKGWTDFTGWDLKKLKKQGWWKLIHPEELPTVKQNWMRAVKTENDFEMEFRILDKNGDYKWHISRAIPVKNDTGKIIMWVGANTEIQKLKEEEKRKEDFLKMVSHELKTPITSIKGYTQILLSMMEDDNEIERNSQRIKPSLQRIDSQITRLTRLISEMLDVDRIKDNQLFLQKEIFHINELVKDTIEDINYAYKQTHITLKIESICHVNADKDRIGQVLINFITNAIKYSPDDKNIEIKVFQTDDNKVSVSVKDHGIGVEKKDQQNIFKQFYRVSGKNEETYAGFGIGLYLAKEIIERHNGHISMNSKKGEGSEFIFTLPVNAKTGVKGNKDD
jgi:two-component system CheB/CheR fusion protein